MLLKRFFTNPFLKLSIGISKFRTLVENHIANLTANNGGGLFTQMIAETSNLYQSLFGADAPPKPPTRKFSTSGEYC